MRNVYIGFGLIAMTNASMELGEGNLVRLRQINITNIAYDMLFQTQQRHKTVRLYSNLTFTESVLIKNPFTKIKSNKNNYILDLLFQESLKL
jgi:hypothetical protein